jgi:hypothetical protein
MFFKLGEHRNTEAESRTLRIAKYIRVPAFQAPNITIMQVSLARWAVRIRFRYDSTALLPYLLVTPFEWSHFGVMREGGTNYVQWQFVYTHNSWLGRGSLSTHTSTNGRQFKYVVVLIRRSQWPRGLRRRSAAERLLGSWHRIPPEAWMFVSCTVFGLSGRGLCDGSIPRPEEYYRLWRVFQCDQVEIKTDYTCCEQVGRRGNDYET